MTQPIQNSPDKQNELLSIFQNQLVEHFSFILPGKNKQKKVTPILLAMSGGLDSMVLGQLLKACNLPTIWVHCNFHLRADESDRDMDFVERSAAQSGVQLLIRHFDTEKYAHEHKMSIEQAARFLRYDLFEKLIAGDKTAWGADSLPNTLPKFLMTAHHANDQIETLLLNLFRGCGISGLHGMATKNRYILRPLLAFKRKDLEGYAQQMKLKWVEDSTNMSVEYTRNFLRHNVLPQLKQQYPYIEDTLLGNIERFRQAELLYHQGLEKYKKRLISYQGSTLRLSVLMLKKSDIKGALLWEVLKNYGFGYRQIPELEKLLWAQSGSFQDNPEKDWRVLRNRAHLLVLPLEVSSAEIILIQEATASIQYQQGILKIDKVEARSQQIKEDPAMAFIDYNQLQFPLQLRKWKPGDYFYPLGLGKKKKIARFLTDQKLSLQEKQEVWVLESGNKILWVVGYRLDDRFKIKQGTQKILKLKLRKEK